MHWIPSSFVLLTLRSTRNRLEEAEERKESFPEWGAHIHVILAIRSAQAPPSTVGGFPHGLPEITFTPPQPISSISTPGNEVSWQVSLLSPKCKPDRGADPHSCDKLLCSVELQAQPAQAHRQHPWWCALIPLDLRKRRWNETALRCWSMLEVHAWVLLELSWGVTPCLVTVTLAHHESTDSAAEGSSYWKANRIRAKPRHAHQQHMARRLEKMQLLLDLFFPAVLLSSPQRAVDCHWHICTILVINWKESTDLCKCPTWG